MSEKLTAIEVNAQSDPSDGVFPIGLTREHLRLAADCIAFVRQHVTDCRLMGVDDPIFDLAARIKEQSA